MTPAVAAARAAGVDFTLHEYTCQPDADQYGLEAAACNWPCNPTTSSA